MNLKHIIAVTGVLVVLGFGYSYVGGARANAIEAEARVKFLEAERVELERQAEEANEGYEALIDSLAQAHDSLAEVRAEAVETASEASRDFNEGIETLRDSLEAYDGLGVILDQIETNHQEEVVAYQVQVQTLEADKFLLQERIVVLDSMWLLEQGVNEALRTEIAALHEESDAWERVANSSFFGKLGGAVPYVVAGAGIALLIK
jgi:chromosome segregation ATPase